MQEDPEMKVGVLGSGVVGQTLAGGFLKHGHDVMVGTQHAAKLADWGAKNPRAMAGVLRRVRSQMIKSA